MLFLDVVPDMVLEVVLTRPPFSGLVILRIQALGANVTALWADARYQAMDTFTMPLQIVARGKSVLTVGAHLAHERLGVRMLVFPGRLLVVRPNGREIRYPHCVRIVLGLMAAMITLRHIPFPLPFRASR